MNYGNASLLEVIQKSFLDCKGVNQAFINKEKGKQC